MRKSSRDSDAPSLPAATHLKHHTRAMLRMSRARYAAKESGPGINRKRLPGPPARKKKRAPVVAPTSARRALADLVPQE